MDGPAYDSDEHQEEVWSSLKLKEDKINAMILKITKRCFLIFKTRENKYILRIWPNEISICDKIAIFNLTPFDLDISLQPKKSTAEMSNPFHCKYLEKFLSP